MANDESHEDLVRRLIEEAHEEHSHHSASIDDRDDARAIIPSLFFTPRSSRWRASRTCLFLSRSRRPARQVGPSLQ